MGVGTDGADPLRIRADGLEHRTGLVESADFAFVGGVQQRFADEAVGDLQQCADQVTDVGRRSDLVGHHVHRRVTGRQPGSRATLGIRLNHSS